MDWIESRSTSTTEEGARAGTLPVGKHQRKLKKQKKKSKSKSLAKQLSSVLAQPLASWSRDYERALKGLKWPRGCDADRTLVWSVVMQEQAEVLAAVGLPVKKLATIVAETPASSAQEKTEQVADLEELLDQSLESKADEWLDSLPEQPSAALAAIALAWHLPELATDVDATWLTPWVKTATDCVAEFLPSPDCSVLCNLAMQCELPLLFALLAGGRHSTRLKEANQAAENLAEYLVASQDEPAAWLMHGATYLRASLASVLRSRILADALGCSNWYAPQRKALAGLLQHAARWSRADGTQLLGAGQVAPRAQAVWDALAGQAKQTKPLSDAMTLAGIGSGKRRELRKNVAEHKLPALTHHSEDASTACMQADWRDRSTRVAVDYSEKDVCLEVLGPKGHPVLAGDWKLKVEREGHSQLQLGSWGEVCWFSDEDVDYLELEAQCGQQARVQRQLVLFREERVLLLADTLLADERTRWALHSELPLAADCEFQPAKKTTEGFIQTSGKSRCLTLPLFLPEWRRQLSMMESTDRLVAGCESLIARAEANTDRLYVATCIQLMNSKPKQQFTWRSLTVGEDLRIVQPHEAVAYRLQLGEDQLVIYRSLAPPARRTAVGMHTLAEFFVGRLDAEDGEVDTVVEVEANLTED